MTFAHAPTTLRRLVTGLLLALTLSFAWQSSGMAAGADDCAARHVAARSVGADLHGALAAEHDRGGVGKRCCGSGTSVAIPNESSSILKPFSRAERRGTTDAALPQGSDAPLPDRPPRGIVRR